MEADLAWLLIIIALIWIAALTVVIWLLKNRP